MAVIDRDLGYRAEHPLAQSFEFRRSREQHWYETGSDEISDPAFRGCQGEHPIGGIDQPPREGDALGLVAVQQSVRGAAVENRRPLPSQVDCVPDTSVHTLSAGGTVDMRSVTE